MKKILFICLLSISSYGENLSDTCVRYAIEMGSSISVEKTCDYGQNLTEILLDTSEREGCNKLYPFATYQGIAQEQMTTEIETIRTEGKKSFCTGKKQWYYLLIEMHKALK